CVNSYSVIGGLLYHCVLVSTSQSIRATCPFIWVWSLYPFADAQSLNLVVGVHWTRPYPPDVFPTFPPSHLPGFIVLSACMFPSTPHIAFIVHASPAGF